MSKPSNWELAPESSRLVVPREMVGQLADHPLCGGLYPTGLGYYQIAANHAMQRRKHDDNLMIYCLDGRGELTVENETHKVHAGDLIILPDGVAHAYKASEKAPWTIYWVHFSGEKSRDFVDYLSIYENHFILPLGVHSRLVTDFEELLESMQSSFSLTASVYASNQLRKILALIVQLQSVSRKQKVAHNMNIEHIHSLMQARLHEPLDLEDFAKAANLSKYHFVKKYKELTGTTPINHFIHLKIERACHLLDITTKSINEISYDVGYDDAYYFSRIFKKIMGLSPSQYRRMRLSAYPNHP